ncbi:MAG: N-acetylglucosamine-6-phosphate deacetylase [Butyrivibrio sp.]|nr:N-acetylglucosamine-6-phosphate deacetylase [Butyrivibrio sp.]
MIIKGGEVFGSDGRFHRRDVAISDGFFSDDEKACSDDRDIYDASGDYVLPGLIDIHFHGAMGYDVCDKEMDGFEAIAGYELVNGVTAICPATLTLPITDLKEVLRIGKEFSDKDHKLCAELIGFNMEGPFISRARKGAQNEKYILGCDGEIVREFLDASGGLLKIIGLAPECNPHFEDYIRDVRDMVKVSLAHTDADFDICKRAFDAGASHVVHLYNAMRGLSHRDPGLVGAAAESKNITCEIICDGVHIHPAAVRAAFTLMGSERMILISDSLRCTGMPDGSYDLGGQDVCKKGNLCTLASEGNIAGSVSNLFDCLKTAVLDMNIPIEEAVAAATINPARCIGEDRLYGSIESGKKGDIIIVDRKDFSLRAVIKNGKLVKKAEVKS